MNLLDLQENSSSPVKLSESSESEYLWAGPGDSNQSKTRPSCGFESPDRGEESNREKHQKSLFLSARLYSV